MAEQLKMSQYADMLARQAADGSVAGVGFVPPITIGYVVDTNDPQQMGRVRAVCPFLQDRFDSLLEDIPWAMYATPFGGSIAAGTKGPEDDETVGPTSYGMWAIPKIGAQVLVMCIDGNPMQRVWIGCLYGQFLPHTLPHGRYVASDHPLFSQKQKPVGPLSTIEHPIQPLFKNFKIAFGNFEKNHEWYTRGADYSVARVDTDVLETTRSSVPDDHEVDLNGATITQGYGISRIAPNLETKITDKNYDPTVYSITSPGFHSISMDDRQENCRIRLRTTSGHQILLDDTNERIYISTAKGNNWIEMDQAGNIDIFTEGNISTHSKKDINLTADGSIRLYGSTGIHLNSGDQVRIQSRSHTHINAGESIFIGSTLDLNLKAGGALLAESAADINLLASGQILETGSAIHLNGPPAASSTAPLTAFLTSRLPQHEPWARVMTKDDTTHEPELSYDDPNVGKIERGVVIERGPKWRR